jgi:hypothetical protein
MLKLLTGLTLWLLLFAIYPLTSRAQVHGSGGGPDNPGEHEAVCVELLDKSRELEKAYLDSRNIHYAGDQSFFDEIRSLTAKSLYKTVSKTKLMKTSCNGDPLPRHTPEQVQMLNRIGKIWQRGIESPKKCLGKFNSRSRHQSSLQCVIQSLTHESE